MDVGDSSQEPPSERSLRSRSSTTRGLRTHCGIQWARVVTCTQEHVSVLNGLRTLSRFASCMLACGSQVPRSAACQGSFCIRHNHRCCSRNRRHSGQTADVCHLSTLLLECHHSYHIPLTPAFEAVPAAQLTQGWGGCQISGPQQPSRRAGLHPRQHSCWRIAADAQVVLLLLPALLIVPADVRVMHSGWQARDCRLHSAAVAHPRVHPWVACIACTCMIACEYLR